ncbi:unnamed protein product [Ectocarpus sp. 8 AP-2014]
MRKAELCAQKQRVVAQTLYSHQQRGCRTAVHTKIKWTEREQDVDIKTAILLEKGIQDKHPVACCVLWPHGTNRELHKKSSALQHLARRLAQLGFKTETRGLFRRGKHRTCGRSCCSTPTS